MELVNGTLYVSKKEIAEGMKSSTSTVAMYIYNPEVARFIKHQCLKNMGYRGDTFAVTPASVAAMSEVMHKRNPATCNKFISWIDKIVDFKKELPYKEEKIKSKRIQLSTFPELVSESEVR